MRIHEPGIYDIPMADYLQDPCPQPSLSSGACHRIVSRSPRHAWEFHPRLGGRSEGDSNASDIGSVAHDLLLGGEGKICVIEPSDYRSKPTKDNPDGSIPVGWTNVAIRAARDEARENGLTPILAAEYGAARIMANTAREFIKRTRFSAMFEDGDQEKTLIWQEDGVWFRARPDWLSRSEDCMLHYKTTQASASPEPFIRGVMPGMGYDISVSFYRRGIEAVFNGAKYVNHLILVQEQKPPYACSLVGMSPVMFAIADDKVKRAIRMWRECMKAGDPMIPENWPAYSTEVHYAEPTPWALAAAEEAALQEGA